MGVYKPFRTIPEMFDVITKEFLNSDRPLFLRKVKGKYEGITYAEYRMYVKRFMLGLHSIGVKEGDKVKAGDNLFTVAQLNKVKAKVWASLIEVQYIKPGMDATMKINGDVYTGKVSVVDLSIDPKHNAYGVEIVFDNYHGKIRSGVTADIRINAYKRNNAIVVPRRYIVFDGDEKFVFVEKDGKAYKQTVKTGIESSIDIEITEGLNPGDRLITDGIFLLRNGSKVKIVN